MSDALRTMLLASADADDTIDPAVLLAQVQQKIREGIDPTDDEMRHVILAARAGRRAAATGQKKARTAAPVVSIDTLFKRSGSGP
jgi:hypothetical protein